MAKFVETHRSPLLPDRHPEPDFFVADIFDATPKADQAGMEHPLFTLATKPDFKPVAYEVGDVFVNITPNATYGRATVHDRDILIFCISQCMARINAGDSVSDTIRFSPHEFMKMTNRDTSGQSYKNFENALRRLQGTQIETNIEMGGQEEMNVFSFIDHGRVLRETRDGRATLAEVKLSRWLFRAIEAKGRDLLTLDRAYFRLRKPLERRLYEIVRKHCGAKQFWKIGLAKLHAKTGSQSTRKEFKRLITKIIADDQEHNHIPEYNFELVGDMVEVTRINVPPPLPLLDGPVLSISEAAREKGREVAPGWDIYGLEAEWREWASSKGIEVKNPDKHFIGFCKSRGPYR